MGKRMKLLLIFIAIMLALLIAINEYVLFKIDSIEFHNWFNDSLFYSISLILWAVFLPLIYSVVKKTKGKKKVFILSQFFVLSFIISIIHQVLANVIFYSILFLKDELLSEQSLLHQFRELVLTGMFMRLIESIIITSLFYVISSNEVHIRNFIASYWPKLYKLIVDQKDVIQVITIKEKGTMISLDVNKIMYFESSGNYIEIHNEDKTYLLRQTMSRLLTELDPITFIRVHRSYILNINFIEHVSYIKNSEYRINLNDSTQITSSRNYKLNIKSLLKLKRIPLD
jgi:hypothetical protein